MKIVNENSCAKVIKISLRWNNVTVLKQGKPNRTRLHIVDFDEQTFNRIQIVNIT